MVVGVLGENDMDNNYRQFGEDRERFFSDAYAPIDTPAGWNKWYQEYRKKYAWDIVVKKKKRFDRKKRK